MNEVWEKDRPTVYRQFLRGSLISWAGCQVSVTLWLVVEGKMREVLPNWNRGVKAAPHTKARRGGKSWGDKVLTLQIKIVLKKKKIMEGRGGEKSKGSGERA